MRRLRLSRRLEHGLTYAARHARSARAGQVRVVIFAQGRSGSTLLESLIASTGLVRRNGEMLGPRKGVRYPLPYVLGRSRRTPEHFVFHLKIQHLWEGREPPIDARQFLNELLSDGWRIVFLQRRNKLLQYVSNQIAIARGKYHKYDDLPKTTVLDLDLDHVVGRIERLRRIDQLERTILTGLPHLEIVYERDLEDAARHQETADRVFRYLSLPTGPVHTKLRKINPRPLADIVLNHAALAQRLKEHGWSEYLEPTEPGPRGGPHAPEPADALHRDTPPLPAGDGRPVGGRPHAAEDR